MSGETDLDAQWQDVELELSRVRGFFEALPEEMRADVAYRFTYEMALWGGRDHFQILGILVEAILAYREAAMIVQGEEEEA